MFVNITSVDVWVYQSHYDGEYVKYFRNCAKNGLSMCKNTISYYLYNEEVLYITKVSGNYILDELYNNTDYGLSIDIDVYTEYNVRIKYDKNAESTAEKKTISNKSGSHVYTKISLLHSEMSLFRRYLNPTRKLKRTYHNRI